MYCRDFDLDRLTPQHHSVLLKMPYFIMEVADERKPMSIVSTLAVYEFETYIEAPLSVHVWV